MTWGRGATMNGRSQKRNMQDKTVVGRLQRSPATEAGGVKTCRRGLYGQRWHAERRLFRLGRIDAGSEIGAVSGARLTNIGCLRGHSGWGRSAAFSPDGARIAGGLSDNTVRLWDAASGAELACLRRHEKFVAGVAFSPDRRRVARGSADRTVRLWDAASGGELACLRGTNTSSRASRFRPTAPRSSAARRTRPRAYGTYRKSDSRVDGVVLSTERGVLP